MTTAPIVVPLVTSTRPARSDPARAVPRQFTQGALALTFPDDVGHMPSLRLVSGAAAMPDLERWATGFLQAVVEVVASDRSPAQLLRWTSRQVYSDITERHHRVAAHRAERTIRATRHQVASVRICVVANDIAEVSARVVTGQRSRAIAARLERRHERWVCTELVFG